MISNFVTKNVDLLYYEGKRFHQKQTVNDVNFSTIPKGYKLYIDNSTFFSPIYTFFLAGNTIFYTTIQGRNRKNYFNHIIYKGKMPTLAGNKHLSVLFFFHRPRLFHLSTEKCMGLIRQKWTSKWLFPRRHINRRSKRFSIRGNY